MLAQFASILATVAPTARIRANACTRAAGWRLGGRKLGSIPTGRSTAGETRAAAALAVTPASISTSANPPTATVRLTPDPFFQRLEDGAQHRERRRWSVADWAHNLDHV